MSTNYEKAIKRLRELEAQAESMRDECHKTRMLLEDGVSTPTKKSKVDLSVVAKVTASRKSFYHKKAQQSQPARHS